MSDGLATTRRRESAAHRESGEDATLDHWRRSLQIALGAIWLVDAVLQFQPYMFTRAFVTGALEPVAPGNPWMFYQPMIWADHLVLHDIAWWNVLFAVIQLTIGLGLLWRPAVRIALGTSLVWSVAVWWIAEGFGGIFTGSSPISGEPGAVILYALIAVLVWPRSRDEGSVATATVGRGLAYGLWVVLWADFAVYLLLPTNRAPQSLHNALVGLESGEPGWVRSLDAGLASVFAHAGTPTSVILAALCVAIGLSVLVPRLLRPALVLAVAFAAAVWVTQDFGGILTSQGTDVNSGPLIALFAIAYWPLSASPVTRRHRELLGATREAGPSK